MKMTYKYGTLKFMTTKDKIAQILSESLSVVHIQIVDDSDQHVGHPEAVKSGGGHFSVLIVANDFQGKKLMERHRMVYAALKEELKSQVHALRIKALSTDEYKS